MGFLPLFVGVGLISSGVSASTPTRNAVKSQDEVLAKGLKIWRKSGRIDGGASCATCHSPDGIELAVYNFDDANLKRRAAVHLNAEDTQTIVNYVHALRAKLNLRDLRDPNENRPLQPGGTVLAGNTATERDLAFGHELKVRLPHFFEGRIDSLAKAKVAEKELLDLSPIQLKIGIPLNRLSEDFVHGDDHASIAQWLPEIAPLIPEEDLQAWYSLEDKYLANPTQENLKSLFLHHVQVVKTSRMLGFPAISALKFRALLIWQDRIRHHSEADAVPISTDILTLGSYNAFWDVGDMVRQMMGRDPQSLGMPPETVIKKTGATPLADQFHQLRAAWFWAGWLSDQGLFKTSYDDKTRYGLWMAESLSKDGPYPMHSVYATARRQAVVSNNPSSWGEAQSRKRRIWDFAGLRAFSYFYRDIPTNPEHRDLYIKFASNSIRMNLLLLKEDLVRTHLVWQKMNTKGNTAELIHFLRTQDPAGAATDEPLGKEILKLTEAAKDRNSYPQKN